MLKVMVVGHITLLPKPNKNTFTIEDQNRTIKLLLCIMQYCDNNKSLSLVNVGMYALTYSLYHLQLMHNEI